MLNCNSNIFLYVWLYRIHVKEQMMKWSSHKYTLEIKSKTPVSASQEATTQHDDVIKWKHFPHHWPFVWGIHQSPVNSPHKGQWYGALMFSLICALNKWLSKQLWGWWFERPSRSLWRHCNEWLWYHNDQLSDVVEHRFLKSNPTNMRNFVISQEWSVCLRLFTGKAFETTVAL